MRSEPPQNIKRIIIEIADKAFLYASAGSSMAGKIKISNTISFFLELSRKRLYKRITMIDPQAVAQNNKRPGHRRLQRLDDGERDTVSASRIQKRPANPHPAYLLTIIIGEVLRIVWTNLSVTSSRYLYSAGDSTVKRRF